MAAVIPLKLLYDGPTPVGHSELRPGDFLPVLHGGTGLAAIVAGGLLHASATDTIAALPIGTLNQVLVVTGGGLPAWSSSITVTQVNTPAIASASSVTPLAFLQGATPRGSFDAGGVFVIPGAMTIGGDVVVGALRRSANSERLMLAGGSTLSTDDGAIIQAIGNTFGSGVNGSILYQLGAVAEAHHSWRGSGGAEILRITDSGITTLTGDLVTGGIIRRGTADGADNSLLSLAGGGSNASSRGAHIEMYGNEHAGLGILDLSAGLVAGGKVRLWTNDVERLTIDNAGVVLIGTTVTTSAGAGDIVLANAKRLRGVNFAGTAAREIIHMNTSDQVEIAGTGDDIRWGRAVVAMGGGATALLGTIGGSGPTAAAQNTWVRMLDSNGTAMWLAAWR